MAAVANTSHTTSTLTPPSSSHGPRNDMDSWDLAQDGPDKLGATDSLGAPYVDGYEVADAPDEFIEKRKPPSVNASIPYDRENGLRSPITVDGGSFGESLSNHQSHTRAQSCASEHRSREKPADPVASNSLPNGGDADKWIHRDKLAKIENAELQAAGIVLPKPRAVSRRRDRSEHSHSRADDVSRKNSMSTDLRPIDIPTPVWDLRLPEEIREETMNSYWESPLVNGKGSRIPLARSSPAPIPTDFIDRDAPIGRSKSHDAETDPLRKSRSRSSSVKTNGEYSAFQQGSASGTPAKRGSDTSSRKISATRKTSVPPGRSSSRPKTRAGKDNGSGRPGTRSGDMTLSGGSNKQPEGDPPWMISAYQPDPRLPPEEQLLPTVARRLQQEKWEKEGKFGTVYDKEFRPLNDESLLKPHDRNGAATAAPNESNEEHETYGKFEEWPLKTSDIPRSPTVRSNPYSTMPKIVDKPPSSPILIPRGNNARPFSNSRLETLSQTANEQPISKQNTNPRMNHHYQPQHQTGHAQQKQEHQQAQEEKEKEKDAGCGCCIVM
ncbi:hypothetical protein Cpir12675_006313 [Ceratocystis pirilliformis]|uniref:TeaA receptor TeaR n=1 Tax=Ceratocystis pirilliformis TaxID=259994 RepID=A0ABR3YJU6_9PEZI